LNILGHRVKCTLLTPYRDLPQSLQDSGGWINEEIIGLYGDYSRLVFQTLGDRVKTWITINEPFTFCYYGYGEGTFPPGVKTPATGPYDCVHTMLKAHALVYHIYKEEFLRSQKGSVGISIDSVWQEPADRSSPDDVKAAEQSFQFRVKKVSSIFLSSYHT
jgi:beta-glucosidase/6-phospho-beta-glucosidase/beta-galactosidase